MVSKTTSSCGSLRTREATFGSPDGSLQNPYGFGSAPLRLFATYRAPRASISRATRLTRSVKIAPVMFGLVSLTELRDIAMDALPFSRQPTEYQPAHSPAYTWITPAGCGLLPLEADLFASTILR